MENNFTGLGGMKQNSRIFISFNKWLCSLNMTRIIQRPVKKIESFRILRFQSGLKEPLHHLKPRVH